MATLKLPSWSLFFSTSFSFLSLSTELAELSVFKETSVIVVLSPAPKIPLNFSQSWISQHTHTLLQLASALPSSLPRFVVALFLLAFTHTHTHTCTPIHTHTHAHPYTLTHTCTPTPTHIPNQSGEECMILPTVSNDDAQKLFPKGFKTAQVPSGKPYMRLTPQPEWT